MTDSTFSARMATPFYTEHVLYHVIESAGIPVAQGGTGISKRLQILPRPRPLIPNSLAREIVGRDHILS